MTERPAPNIMVEIECSNLLSKISEWEKQRLSKAQVLANVVDYLKDRIGVNDYRN